MITVYITKDNKQFDKKDEALAHEKTLLDIVTLKAEVREMMSQILIKLRDVESAVASGSGYDAGIDNSTALIDKYLSCVKAVLEQLNEPNEYNAETMLTKYYDSSCF